ncbi:glycosyltransferase family 4 protein [Oceanobacillus bengalensis]|uniref:Glycosyltransferase family 4 protein n=1 Tax=Oceanobacillus bengalensis TaxID=1435466 RepID=A0A494YZU6_9BACI|nr:glycosyltransferase family 4 protein [Oceanobacillus bengalensis]RKQ15713.1 glycosyltransferase family 4 protein [Oceanobacillus bengalensis]
MKLLLISNMYPDKDNPNYGVFVKNTENILLDEGFEVDKVVFFKQKGHLKKLLLYIIYYIKIIWKGLFSTYDIIYVHYAAHNSLALNFLYKIKPVRIFTNVHGSDVVPEFRKREKLQKHVHTLLNHSDRIITPSNYYKEVVTKKYNIDPQKIRVFPSGGIDFNTFHPLDKRKAMNKLGLSHDVNYIGYVGRIDVLKGWDIFLQALKMLNDEGKLKNTKAIMIGNGLQIQKLHELINKSGLDDKIVYFDFMNQNDLKYAYNAIDVFCFPTMREGESLGLVGLEAMACARPVIGSEMGGILDYTVNDLNGFLFRPGDPSDLKNKIEKFMKLSDKEKGEMSIQAINTAEKYELGNIKPILVDIFRA